MPPINWSLVLNVLLLIGVIIMITRLVKARRYLRDTKKTHCQPTLGKIDNNVPHYY